MMRLPSSILAVACLLVISVGARESLGDQPKVACVLLQEQLIKGGVAAKKDLAKYGFAQVNHMPEPYPFIIIDQSIIKNCDRRLTTEYYIVNKIYGKKHFSISEGSFKDAKKDIAYAVFRAVTTTGVWKDGVSHEIDNTVDDILFPEWLHWQIEILKRIGPMSYAFTKRSFEHPDPRLVGVVMSGLETTKSAYITAIWTIIQKNISGRVDVAATLMLIETREMPPGLEREQMVEALGKLLKQDGRITFEQLFDFEGNLLGWS